MLRQTDGPPGRVGPAHCIEPSIAPEKRGMIQPDCRAPPSAVVLDDIDALLGDRLSMMTIAPELAENGEMIRALAGRGTIASQGHSKATYEQRRAGVYGARAVRTSPGISSSVNRVR